MNYTNILFEKENNIGLITINRPDKLNALNKKTLEELSSVINLIKNDSSIKAVIITGRGEKAFIAGADISEINKLTPVEAKTFAEFGQSIFNSIEKLDIPVIAAVNGFALGGGCELALACHIRIASANAKFGQPEINLGIIPGYGGTQRLARKIGTARAYEMILTGDMINAESAKNYGLVTDVFEQNELITKAKELAGKIASKPLQAIKFSMKAINCVYQTHLDDGLSFEANYFADVCGTEDFKEGTAAFLEKRKPAFKDK